MPKWKFLFRVCSCALFHGLIFPFFFSFFFSFGVGFFWKGGGGGLLVLAAACKIEDSLLGSQRTKQI